MLRCVYYFPLDDKLEETLPPIAIRLLSDGTADISKLPANIQDQLRVFGVQDITHTEKLYPKDGEAFLEALLENNSLYFRFRTQPEPRI